MLLISDLQGADFDVSLTGIDPAEIDDLFKDSLKDGVKDDEFDVDAELQKPTITKAGDVWTLGRHRLVCWDSTKPETFALLMEGLKANLVITDPPYNVNYEGGAERSRMTTWKTLPSTTSCWQRFRIQRKSWRTMLLSMCSTRTPRG